MNTASFGITFATPFCVVSRSGFRVQPAATLDEAEAIALRTVSTAERVAAVYGAGSGNRLALYDCHYDGRVTRFTEVM